jgi:protein CWC15
MLIAICCDFSCSQEAERKVEEERIRTENILKGNPLLGKGGQEKSDFKVKRR